ncbi:MAG: hypothetical protein IPL46_25360 [Saprospiraceae bacterium]|nr:hypothetical protein [Saprospiraceae bacterium]
MSAKNRSSIPDEIIKYYDQLIATIPHLERKGATMPYTSLNGHMFSFIDKEDHFSLRLPQKEREDFIKRYSSSLSVQYGRVMQEYVLVPEALFINTKELSQYFSMSYDYVGTLKPKNTIK